MREHLQCDREIRVGEQRVRFASEPTRWLGIWLDSSLTLAENRRRRLGKARQAEARLRRIVSTYGVPPAAARTLQSTIIQGTVLYASELTWSGGRGVEGEYQRAISWMGRAVLGTFRSTPRHSCGGKRPHPGEGTPQPPTGKFRPEAPRQTQGWRRARGDSHERGSGPHDAP